jgi:hypothetical protein
MSRLTTRAADQITEGARGTLEQDGIQVGFVPNMFATLASNPAVLDLVEVAGQWEPAPGRQDPADDRACGRGAQWCDYCLAIHTAGSHQGGVTAEDIELSRARNLDPLDVPTSRGSRSGSSRPAVTSATATLRP